MADATPAQVSVAGPADGRCVVILEDDADAGGTFDEIRDRLHVAMFRTIALPADPRRTVPSAIAILDRLRIRTGLLVGDRAGGELAWRIAAAQPGRFIGLVLVDAHPGDSDCLVTVDTTALVSGHASYSAASACRRHVHGEYRLVEMAGPRRSRHFTAQLVTEIVLRSLSR